MILLNGERLSTFKGDERCTWAEEKMSEIKRQGKTQYIFKLRKGVALVQDKDGRYIPDPTSKFIDTLMIANKEENWGTDTWIYTRSENKQKGRDASLLLRETNSYVAEKDYEIIFFLKELHPLVKTNYLFLYNKIEEAKQKNIEISQDADVKFLIYSKNSPISPFMNGDDETKLRNVAQTWGVSSARSKDIEELKLELYETVLDSHNRKNSTKRGFDEFIKQCSKEVGSKEDEVRISVTRAIDDGNIKYIKPTSEWVWEDDKVIYKLSPSEEGNPDNAIVEYFITRPAELKALQGYVKSTQKDYSRSDLESMSWADIRKLTIDMNKFSTKMTKDECIEAILG